MKLRRALIGTVLALSFMILSGCSEANDAPIFSDAQTREVAELTTLDAHYHDVASITSHDKVIPFVEKENRLFFEFDAVAHFGIDVSKVTIAEPDAKGNVVVKIPQAGLLGSNKVTVLSDTISDPIDDRGLFVPPFTPKQQADALALATDEITKKAEQDDTLKARARQHAKDILEYYVKNIGKELKREFTVTFEDAE